MNELLIQILFKVVEKGIKFGVTSRDGMLKTYYDRNGQRQCYLTHYWDGTHDEQKTPFFTVRRHLTFTNKDDEGKQGAILFTLNLRDITEKTHVVIKRESVEVGNLIFHFREPVA